MPTGQGWARTEDPVTTGIWPGAALLHCSRDDAATALVVRPAGHARQVGARLMAGLKVPSGQGAARMACRTYKPSAQDDVELNGVLLGFVHACQHSTACTVPAHAHAFVHALRQCLLVLTMHASLLQPFPKQCSNGAHCSCVH